MEIKRECYLVYFRGKRTIREIKKIEEIDIFYESKKFNYLTIYIDKDNEKKVLNRLKRLRGVLKYEKSLLEQPKVNINL